MVYVYICLFQFSLVRCLRKSLYNDTDRGEGVIAILSPYDKDER